LVLAAKNSASGPSSSANLTHGLSALRGAGAVAGVFVIVDFPLFAIAGRKHRETSLRGA
jgi:hypothetical protein